MNIELLIPEFIILGTAFLLLVLEFFLPRGSRKGFGLVGIIGTVAAGIVLMYMETGRALSGLFILDGIAIFFKWLIALTNIFILYIIMQYEERIRNWRGEFYSLILFAIAGMMFMVSSADFVSFYVSLELSAVCLYVLAAYTTEDPLTVEAGLKYLVTGALASGFLVFGISFIFGSTNATEFTEIAKILKGSGPNGFLLIGLALVVIGLTFKVSSIPFHVWSPDVYQGAPTPVAALLAAVSKSAGFAVFMRIMFAGLAPARGEWLTLIIILSAASLVFGNLAAMPQKDIKRLIAYAGIGSAGYLLISIAAMSPLGAGAIMFYLLTYVFAIVGSFLAIVVFYNSEGSYGIESFSGLSLRSPILAASLFIGLLSIAGIPPLGGFIAKLYIIASAVKEGLWFLAVAGVVMAIVAMYYFLLVVKAMYLRPPVKTEPIYVDPTTKGVLYFVNGMTVFLGIYPGPFTDWVMDIAKVLF